MKKINLLASLATLIFLPLVSAQDRPDHFKGKPAPTLEAALANLQEGNAQLAALLAQQSLSAKDLLHVHQLSYTLEVALAKLGAEQARLAELMEKIHLASERNDGKTVKSAGTAYLQGIAPLHR
jgi:hypothetical protein